MTQGRWFLVGFLALGLTAAGFLWWRFAGQPQVPSGSFPATMVSGQGAQSPSTEKLLQALHQRLGQLDLLKLEVGAPIAFPVTVAGALLPSIQESYRLPLRYQADYLAGQLEDAVKPMGARLLQAPVSEKATNGDELFHCDFTFDSQWAPVEITFVGVAAPKICLIIDDGGYQRGKTLDQLYDLRVPLTVSIIPDVEFSKSLAEEFPSHGVEVMCHMPMEGHEKGAVGGNYKALLRKGMDISLAKDEVKEALEDLPNCRGLNNHMGSVATEDADLMSGVCEVLKSEGLFVIDSRTTAKSMVEKEALEKGVPVARRNVFLDDVETPEAIRKQMGLLASYAKKHGLGVGIGHFKMTTLRTLDEEVKNLQAEGFQFIYASEAVK